ncbi:class I SAM-dependent methyltransferase [Nocardia cyriacigeorgica]|uniref:Phosphatidylethanolamine N-methyltransferase n=1 Tax=Nocardia cyriacigeorgica (strain GUH-2) TaxID=1127134 RepID=H6R969_NOCCG|nr:class I SAM-dependent methyltransferase [Nocardia cyriacigeorgica]BDT87278.1 ubiquinone/menaquinone biosynthesis methyltransferase [Nocardia cyriacigeorgica]CCF63644.1 Phosphatidylethanolamine N-methyltransferase [Nocardia cyriacigeorgica GUH-2]
MSGKAAGDELGHVERVFDRLATGYDRQIGWSERFLLGGARRWAVEQARGEVVEIGVGSGLNLPLYGAGVTRLIGVDLSEPMLTLARARSAAVPVELRRGDVQQLDLPDASADTVVSTYTFCTIPDPGVAARAAWRVLRPGGVFVAVEHGPARSRAVAAVMRWVEPLAVRVAADYLTREPVGYLTDAGFGIDFTDRTGRGGVVFRVLARKPG